MSLTEFTFGFKRFVSYCVIATILYMVGKVSVNAGIDYYKAKHPIPPPPPEARFSKLELPNITALKLADGSSPYYILDTKTGKFPSFPERLPIFPLKTQRTTILSEKRARDVAIFIGFKMEPNKLSTTEFVWDTGQKKVSANTALGLFSLSFDLFNPPSDMTLAKALSFDEAKRSALAFLNANGLSHPDIARADVETTPLVIKDGLFRVEHDVTKASLTRVNFTRNTAISAEKYPVVTVRRKFPLISLIVGRDPLDKTFVPALTYTYWEIDTEGGSEYALSPINSVWEKVKSGGGLLTTLYRKNSDEYEIYQKAAIKRFAVKDVSLVYLETANYSPYLLPYYIFSGEAEYDNGEIGFFDIYHTALTDSDIIYKVNE